MKTSIFKTILLTLFLVNFVKVNAQQEERLFTDILLATNAQMFFDKSEKFQVSDIISNYMDNTLRVHVNCISPATMKIKIFKMNGEMANEVMHLLEIGNNELLLNSDGLSAGTYMVQFYTSEGSALRRFIKTHDN